MQVKTDWRSYVPKDLLANIRWRIDAQERAAVDVEYRESLIQCCEEDPIFWINGFCYTYDPRIESSSKIPFILYDFQEEAILKIILAIGKTDLLIEKSRDMGASWLNVAALTWAWRFKKGQSFLFVSRVEDYVDKAGNPKALFWKADYLIDNSPKWLQPFGYSKSKHRAKMHMENPETGSVIDGESTTGRVARGDRRTAILLDEFASVEQGESVLKSTRDATPCRLFNSTPEGTNNAFYDMREKYSGTDLILRLHWSEHPVKAAGLYCSDSDGNLERLDPAYKYLGDYKFILDGKLRSPWYDGECGRAANAQEIAQELDIDYQGSGWQFFKPDIVTSYVRKTARPYSYRGDLDHCSLTGEPTRFREDEENGRLKLWVSLGADFSFPEGDKIILGCDVSAGTGASNSAICGWNSRTRAKVLDYVNPRIRPEGLALQAVALGKWCGNAFIIWENNGPGRQTGSKIVELGYGNIHYRRQEESISKKVSDIPGWPSTRESKLSLLSEYRNCIEQDTIANYSKSAIEDTLNYIFTPDGGVVHSQASSKKDPSGARSNHGDRVIADALAIKGFGERRFSPDDTSRPDAPIGSLAWRIAEKEKHKEDQNPRLFLPEAWRQ